MAEQLGNQTRGPYQPKLFKADYIDLPVPIIEKCNGLGMDFGGSVIKIVYRPKDKSVRAGEPPVRAGRERVRLMSFSRPELETALHEIAAKADIRRFPGADMSPVNTTGIGSNEYAQKIEETLKVTTNNLTEFDCFIKGFKAICKTLTKSEIIDPPHQEGTEAGEKIIQSVITGWNKMNEKTEGKMDMKRRIDDDNKMQNDELPYAEIEKELYPCVIMMLGSGFGSLKIEADGSFAPFDGNNRGGRSFLGLGNLLTGADSYEELMALAEKGDDHGIHTYTNDFKTDTTKDDIYSFMPDDMLVFNFGKAVKGKLSEFKRETIARGLVVHYATDVVQLAHTSAALAKTKNVFYCGNFCNADVMRREVTKLQHMRSLMPITEVPINYHFLKHGGFMGAIGCFISPAAEAEGPPKPKMFKAEYIDLPVSVLEKCNGLGMDFGGSVIKIVYRPKDKSVRAGEPPVRAGRERVRLMSFSRPELETALHEIAAKADIRRFPGVDLTPVNTTGIGSNEYAQKIEETLKVTTKNLTEFDCFIKGFKLICKTLTKSEIIDPPHREGVEAAEKIITKLLAGVEKMNEKTDGKMDLKMRVAADSDAPTDAELPYAEVEKELYPCMIIMLGSGFGSLKIEADGSFAPFDGSNRGGRSFLGLGNLLTGADSYEELIALAEKGNDQDLHTYTNDFKTDTTKDDIYSFMPDGMLVFNFGKAVKGKLSGFKKESVARGLVVHYATDVAQLAHTSAALAKTKNVFYCGNFCNADVMREEVTKQQLMRSLSPITEIQIKYHFLKHGGFMGAIGCFIAPAAGAEAAGSTEVDSSTDL